MLEEYNYSKEVPSKFWPELAEVENSASVSISVEMKSFEDEKSSSEKRPSPKSGDIKFLDNSALIEEVRLAAKTEQDLTLQVIELIAEINRRKIFLKLGFSSLFDFVTKDLGYEPSSAMRRIQAARAIAEIPELREKIADRSLSLSVVSQGQAFLNKKASDSGKRISIAEKTELFKKLENKSTREAEKELFKLAPELCLKSKEQEKVLSENLTELRFVIDNETKEKMNELKLWMSHQNPDMTQAQFFKVMVEKLHGQLAKKKSNQNKSTDPSQVEHNASITCAEPLFENPKEKPNPITSQRHTRNKPSTKRSRYIPALVKKLVWQRDRGCCQFVDPSTQKKCESRYQIQFDHVHPFRHLGNNSEENLRLLCGKHNRDRD